MSYILDTNIVTYLLKKNEKIILKLVDAKNAQKNIFISVITYYEIKRGLLDVNATQKIAKFNKFCQNAIIISIDVNIAEKASEIHANLKQQGRMIQDVDILIAATAIIHDLTVVSNDSDFTRINDINLENWLI